LFQDDSRIGIRRAPSARDAIGALVLFGRRSVHHTG
jgi:hypothetical protein